MSETKVSKSPPPSESARPPAHPRILYLEGAHDSPVNLRQRLGDEVEIDVVSSPFKALARLARNQYDALYVDAEFFSKAAEVGRLL